MFFFGSYPKKSESVESIRPNFHLVNPDADDANALKELEVARHKWESFLHKNPDIWVEEWLWQNHTTVASTSSPGPIRKKIMEIFYSKVKLRKKLKSLIRGGVPPEWRGRVWHACSGAPSLQKEALSDQQYHSLLERMSELSGTMIEIDINKDLLRTFPDRFDNVDDPFIQSLRRVLSAYAIRNGYIGYCQSMNYLAGLMLLHMEEENAFWTLSALIETILPPNYYSPSLVGGRVDQQVFQSCLKWKLPRVHEAFRTSSTLLEPVTCPWFLCLFVNVIPLYVVCRIWDCLFWEGSTVLFRFGLTMIKSKSHAIIAAKDFITIYSILKQSSPLPNATSFELEHAHEAIASSGRSSMSTDEVNPAVTFGPRSDGEHLIRSAFGYRWLKSVPAKKVNILRAKFLTLMMAEEEERPHHHHPGNSKGSSSSVNQSSSSSSPSKPMTSSTAIDDRREGSSRPSSSSGSKQTRTVSFPSDMPEPSSTTTHSSIQSGSGRRSRKSMLMFQ